MPGGFKEKQWWNDLKMPDDLPEHNWTEHNRPVESISWYDAMAYCRWLSVQQGYEIRLPLETEWEKAARGTEGPEYPWGDEYQTGFANIYETENNDSDFYLQETSAVGIYPQGQSPYGVLDLSGNVWECCLNKYDDPKITTADVSDDVRSVRGGSWGFNTEKARASFRNYGLVFDRNSHLGFRVVCVSPIITDH